MKPRDRPCALSGDLFRVCGGGAKPPGRYTPISKAQRYAKPLHAALDAMSLTSLVKVPKRTGR